jgi:hypothetical protein
MFDDYKELERIWDANVEKLKQDMLVSLDKFCFYASLLSAAFAVVLTIALFYLKGLIDGVL